MTRWLRLIGLWLTASILLAASAQAEPGRLLIVGGGLSLDNEAVYRALIDNRPADAPNIAIVAAASADPSSRAATFAGELMFYGVEPENIAVIELALADDPDTPDIDESDWAANAADAEEVAKIESAGAIWFTGGDQLRLARLLIEPEGGDSPMLAAIRARMAAGAIVGGTSAGAAAMSSPMIARGEGYDALFGPIGDAVSENSGETEPLVLIQGLRLFAPFILDQHFAERGRLGRLARAIMTQPGPARLGLGIDEDTALLVDLAGNSARVIGRGAVTVLDGRSATQSADDREVEIEAITLSRLQDADRFNLTTLAVEPSPARLAIAERRTVFGALWPSIEALGALETELRPLNTNEYRPRGSVRIETILAEGKRRAGFVFGADRDTRYWRGQSDEGWNGTLSGVSLSMESEASLP